MIKLTEIKVYNIELPLKNPFRSANQLLASKQALLLKIKDDSGYEAWSECSAQQHPYYHPETVQTSTHILTQYLIPLMLQNSFKHPREIILYLNQHISGHNFAKAAIEMGCWVIAALQKQQSLATFIQSKKETISSGTVIPIKSIEQSKKVLATAITKKYHRIKIKGDGSSSFNVLHQIISDVPNTITIVLDSNGRLNADQLSQISRVSTIDAFEQPYPTYTKKTHNHFQEKIDQPIFLDESANTISDIENMLTDGVKGIVIKPGRLGGFQNSLSALQLVHLNQANCWCGGMHETGIGKAYNIALAARSEFNWVGDFTESDYYWKQDIIQDPWESNVNGEFNVPFSTPGLGVNVNEEYIKHVSTDIRTIKM
ncbi:o-succinylbenzoate synthase [Candidatus Marinamargulisbacteria bacterium SCGC AG-410-N11]|nr:o-succinylbenzoate synthase [Candidatus Marinamargulisbacteria bacterium SCGC AG-410-N11]